MWKQGKPHLPILSEIKHLILDTSQGDVSSLQKSAYLATAWSCPAYRQLSFLNSHSISTVFYLTWIKFFPVWIKSEKGRWCHVWDIKNKNINIYYYMSYHICMYMYTYIYVYMFAYIHYVYLHTHIILYLYIWLQELGCCLTFDYMIQQVRTNDWLCLLKGVQFPSWKSKVSRGSEHRNTNKGKN